MDVLASPDAPVALAFHSAVWIGMAAGLLTAAAAVVGGFLVRGSTAVPAAGWALAAALVLTVEMAAAAAGSLASPTARGSIRLVAVALGVCPTMSLLGAKRPQHGVWQFIVATLAVVLVLPAVSATLVRPGTPPDLHLLERWFLLLLTIVGWMNFAATRHGAAATLLAAGQIGLSWSCLPLATEATALGTWLPDGLAAVMLAAGGLLAGCQSSLAARRSTTSNDGPRDRYNRPFFALRETLGAAWTLRIADRFNTVAASRGWPCRLHFGGFDPGDDLATATWDADAARAFAALVRRFVSTAWLRRHGWNQTGGDGRP